jgi:hypothetical protein
MPARYVVFYSNRCDHSRELLSKLARHPVSKEIAFVCVDRREIQGSSTYAVLEDEKRVKLPAELSEVPAVLLLEKGNVLVSGSAVSAYLPPPDPAAVGGEPTAYSWTEMGGLSDAYAYIDTSSQDMLAQGSGGSRMMHAFTTLDGGQDIATPAQVDDKLQAVATSDVEAVAARREQEVPRPIART